MKLITKQTWSAKPLVITAFALLMAGCSQFANDPGNLPTTGDYGTAVSTIQESAPPLDSTEANAESPGTAGQMDLTAQFGQDAGNPPIDRPIYPTPTLPAWLKESFKPRPFGGGITPTKTPTAIDFRWIQTGLMDEERVSHRTVTLLGGNVLVVGGTNNATGGRPLNSAEIYDPETHEFSLTGPMQHSRSQHSATVLDNGRVLVVGGLGETSPELVSESYLNSAEIYNPTTGTFSPVQEMAIGRAGHTATLLEDDRILIIGGRGSGGESLAQSEAYLPDAGLFAATGQLTTGRYNHTATLLRDGRVLVLGGRNETVLKSAEIYDPANDRFSRLAQMNDYRYDHSATLLRNGKVLIVGGYGGSDNNLDNPAALTSAELYDPATNQFSTLAPMSGNPIAGHSANLLNNSQVLLVGSAGCSESVEGVPQIGCADYLYDIRTKTFLNLPGEPQESKAVARTSHQAAQLSDGNVLIIGGTVGSAVTNSAEIFFVQD